MKLISKLVSFAKKMGALGPGLAFAILCPGIGVVVLTSTAQQWFPWLEGNGQIPLIVALAWAGLCGLSLVPTHACSLVLGMIYGPVWGAIYALLAVTVGAFFGYYFFGKLIGEKPLEHLREDPKVSKVYDELLGSKGPRTFSIIFLMRLSPLMPFAATNALLASLKVPLLLFTPASLLGLAPRVIGVVLIGSGLKTFSMDQGSHPALLILGGAATFVLPLYLFWVIKRKTPSPTPLKKEELEVPLS